MSVRVRVQNFQSLKDVTAVIDGMTVVTGPNNSGKTALMRAVRGVFINSPAGALVRHGAAHLSVQLTFDDGTDILWEKGWEKPGRKGKTVNRYSINGVALASVGRGVPPEVANLGVREIQASTDKVWPQIAQQFAGTLFLIDKSGAAVAEALSDVEKVGKLTRALKLSEKDRRVATNELKTRHEDVKEARLAASLYDGLDEVSASVSSFSEKDILASFATLTETRALRTKLASANAILDPLSDFSGEVVPERPLSAMQARAALKEARDLRTKLASAKEAESTLSAFEPVVFSDIEKTKRIQALLKVVRLLASRRASAHAAVEKLLGAEVPSLPSAERAEKLATAATKVRALKSRLTKARDLCQSFEDSEEERVAALVASSVAVVDALGDRGECPTCQTVHEVSK